MKYRGDFSLVSTAFGAFAATAIAAHFCVFIGSGVREVLPPDRLIPVIAIPVIALPPGTGHIILWCAVAGLCVAAAALWAHHWFDRVDARDWARNLAAQDRPEPSVR